MSETLRDALRRVVDEHTQAGSRLSLQPGLDPEEIRCRLAAADMPIIDEYVELHALADGVSNPDPNLFGDAWYSDIEHSIELTSFWRDLAAELADAPELEWPATWLALGGGEGFTCVLDASTTPATVIYTFRHGETACRTVAPSLLAYLDATADLVANGSLVWSPGMHRMEQPPEDQSAHDLTASWGRAPQWFIDGAFPARLAVKLAGPAFSPDDSSTVHDFRPLRRLRPAPKVRRAAWFGRPPVAFLESLPTQSSAANGCLTARFILTDADDAAIVGATIHVSIMGMDDVVRDVITDSHGLAEHAFEAPETGFVSCQATTTVRGARIYSSDMVQSARILPVAGPAWRSVWLERETGTHRLHVHAEPVDGEPPGWQIYYRTNPRHWIGVPGEGRSPDGRLATIDEREVWPGPCAVRLSASDGRRHVGEEVVWFEAAGGPFAGLLVDADPPVERNGESWPRLVIVMFGYGDSRLVILGLRWDRDLSDGIVDPADLVALGYGELLTEGEAT